MNQTPTTRLVFRATTTWGRPTTMMLESSVAMKIPTVVTVRTTHLYSKNRPPDRQASPRFDGPRYKTTLRKETERFSSRQKNGDSPRTSPDPESAKAVLLPRSFTLLPMGKSTVSKIRVKAHSAP